MAKAGLFAGSKKSFPLKRGKRLPDIKVSSSKFVDEMLSDKKVDDEVYTKEFEKRTGYRGKIKYKNRSYRMIKSD